MVQTDPANPAGDNGRKTVLFTAFEPSGDDHASAVIAELRRRRPDLSICAWGGPKMQEAGADIIERTGEAAVMGLPGWRTLSEHRKLNHRINQWIQTHRPVVHVPVDSPAANFPLCAFAKHHGSKVVHLVAPQIWAWGKWRIHKLRARTDLVLCLLPFEETWFKARGVPAKFIGHPLFDERPDLDALAESAEKLPQARPRVALMPGSRPAEIQRNFPLLLDAFRRLKADHSALVGVVAATTPAVEQRLREMGRRLGGWPEGLDTLAGDADTVIRWCDIALVVSGTVTLQVARQRKPMVIFYKSSRLFYMLIGRWVLATSLFSLPNLIAGRRIVPELIPHFGDAEAIVHAASDLLESPEQADAQRAELDKIVGQFSGHHAAIAAADEIERMAGLTAD